VIEVLKAIRTKALADGTLVGSTMLNGTHVYQEAPDVDTDALTAWVILRTASESPSMELPRADEVYEFVIAARTSDRADAIAERIVAVFGWVAGTASGTLGSITGRRLAEPITFGIPPATTSSDDATGKLYYRFRHMRVATYAA
jgi:hypothetical protein